MNQRVKRTQRDYTLAFKQTVVDQVESGELTYKQAQARYGIQGLKWTPSFGPPDGSSKLGSGHHRRQAAWISG